MLPCYEELFHKFFFHLLLESSVEIILIFLLDHRLIDKQYTRGCGPHKHSLKGQVLKDNPFNSNQFEYVGQFAGNRPGTNVCQPLPGF